MREFFVERDIIMVLVLTTIIPTYVKLETDKVRMAGDKASRRFYILISSLFYIPTQHHLPSCFQRRGFGVREVSWNSCKKKHKIFWKITLLQKQQSHS